MGACAALCDSMCCRSAQLLDEAWGPVDGDGPGIEVLWGAALEDCSNVDLVLAGGHDSLPVLQTHETCS